jgi:hypothetical protein
MMGRSYKKASSLQKAGSFIKDIAESGSRANKNPKMPCS